MEKFEYFASQIDEAIQKCEKSIHFTVKNPKIRKKITSMLGKSTKQHTLVVLSILLTALNISVVEFGIKRQNTGSTGMEEAYIVKFVKNILRPSTMIMKIF